MNTLLCSSNTNILSFLPNNRALDTGMVKMNLKLNHRSFIFTGKDLNSSSSSTCFELDIEELTQFCYQNNFF